ncbi:unnamed protein product, partial [Didymodactylos carnosus]
RKCLKIEDPSEENSNDNKNNDYQRINNNEPGQVHNDNEKQSDDLAAHTNLSISPFSQSSSSSPNNENESEEETKSGKIVK